MLPFRHLLIGGEPVGSFPASLLTENCAQFFQAVVDRTEAQLACATAFLRRIADVVVGAVNFVDTAGNIATTGYVGSEAANVHMPEIKARLTVRDPLGYHLAHATCTGDAMSTEATSRPESSHLRGLAQNKLAIWCKRFQPIALLH